MANGPALTVGDVCGPPSLNGQDQDPTVDLVLRLEVEQLAGHYHIDVLLLEVYPAEGRLRQLRKTSDNLLNVLQHHVLEAADDEVVERELQVLARLDLHLREVQRKEAGLVEVFVA